MSSLPLVALPWSQPQQRKPGSIDRRSVLLSFVAGAGAAAITGVVFWIARAVLRSYGEDQRLSATFGVALAVALLAAGGAAVVALPVGLAKVLAQQLAHRAL